MVVTNSAPTPKVPPFKPIAKCENGLVEMAEAEPTLPVAAAMGTCAKAECITKSRTKQRAAQRMARSRGFGH
jgi:hypothetical protein